MSSPSHLLIEGVCHAALKRPINASPRIKYTCLSVSSSHIALGCSTGSIYVFERCSLQHVQMVSAEAKDGSIVALSLASSGAALAYATSSGVVVIVDLHLEKRTKPEKLRVTTDHKGASVTALCWDERRVFVGDSNGLVTAVNSGTKASDLLKVPSEVIMRLDQPVVQIDVLNNRVLVSTTKTAYVANTSTQKFNQVGKKIRDGPYGACFYPVTGANSVPIVYSAQPGSRVWEACSDGDVFNTHQFKALLNIPPSPIIPCSLDGFHIEASPLPGPQSLAFRQLYLLGNHFILAVTSTHLVILDPADVKVVLWTREFQDMLNVVCVKRDIYILLPNNTVRLFAFTSVVKYLIEASKSQSAQTALHHLFCQSEFWVLKTISRRPEMLKIAEEILQQNISNEFKLNVERIRDELENKLELMKAKDEHKTFNRNESGIYVLERSSSIGSDDAESEVLMERVRQKRPEEDALSVSSNTSVNGAQKIEERLKEAKNKLTGLKNIIQDKVKRRVSDSVSQSSKVTTPTKEVTAESPNSLKRVNSSESLLSLEMKQSEDDESQKLSRRGSFTSNDVSESSSEILGSSSSSFAVPGKKKKSKQLKGRTIQKSIILPEQLKEHQNQDFSAAYTSSQELDASEESGEVSVSKSSPQGVVSTLNSVKDRVEGQARSFVHLIKEGASKVRGPPKGEAIEVDPKTIATMSKETVVWGDRSFMERVEEDCPEGDLDERSKVNHPEPYLVDLSDLREATTAAQEKLSPDLNPSEILKEWIFVLNRTLQNLHATLITDQQNSQNSSDVSDSPELDRVTDVTFPDFQIPSLSEITDVVPSHFLEHLRNPLYAKDPLKMDEILREQVELLTSLCLEHRVFGNISKYLDRDEDEKDESVVFVRCYFYLLTDAALEKFIQNSKERTTREKRWNFVVDCEQVAGKWERRLAVYLEKDDFAGAMNYLTYLKEKGRFRYTRGLLPR
ncbi:hypothetical protein CAPTEDRAFT_187261 [Capitella teleta]|uniref:HPS5-like beta-propeller domain-containing protein n=1 Tax=Capitella teleta TaxID=283909 RepID=X1ZK31_CAPTE|nr:hypothetical protein CAPTEDRAFT_187261 [Capitella teleta]|eukprot:ELU10100.1 hypothetical protein CAPTEDRAFT_187261 [Capitella teleta]